jgi:CheY-like chemotaxis protein
MRILIVDDTPDTVQLYRLAFSLYGCSVEGALSGVEAVALTQKNSQPFDAILLDIEMPLMNGWETLRAIRELPQGQSAFIALFTAFGHVAAIEEQAMGAGADGIFQKPMMPEPLVEAMLAGVKQRRLKSAV